MQHQYDSLRADARGEEVKAEFCQFFKMKIFTCFHNPGEECFT